MRGGTITYTEQVPEIQMNQIRAALAALANWDFKETLFLRED
jgi:hypothetical protein